jgi:hypothetical protein
MVRFGRFQSGQNHSAMVQGFKRGTVDRKARCPLESKNKKISLVTIFDCIVP